MTNRGNDSGSRPRSAANTQDSRQDRLVKENPVDEIFKEMGLTQEQVREAFQRLRDERGESYGSHLGGRVDEICETCCDEHLQIIFQRTTKVVAKKKNSEEWYATVGTMTVRKVTRKEWAGINLRPVQEGEEEELTVPPHAYKPQFSVETLLTSDYVEPGGPGSGVSGSKKMIKAATHGLSAWEGKYHSTYNYQKIVDLGKYKYRALNIMKKKDAQSVKRMGNRSGVDIHVSGNWTWSDACFLPVPKGEIKYEPLDKNAVEKHRDALGLPGNKAEYYGRRPYWGGQATLKLMDQLIKIVEDFAKETGQLDGRGRLPINWQPLNCVDVIIREPAGGYETIYMREDKSGLYKAPKSSGK